jgi:hypothetical protein
MNRETAKSFVMYVVDDSLNGRRVGADPCAIVRETCEQFKYRSRLVGWRADCDDFCFVAVHSYLDVEIDDNEATELAADYLREIGWFNGTESAPDFLF